MKSAKLVKPVTEQPQPGMKFTKEKVDYPEVTPKNGWECAKCPDRCTVFAKKAGNPSAREERKVVCLPALKSSAAILRCKGYISSKVAYHVTQVSAGAII